MDATIMWNVINIHNYADFNLDLLDTTDSANWKQKDEGFMIKNGSRLASSVSSCNSFTNNSSNAETR